MKKQKRVVAIFIAYNATKTLEAFYKNFPKKLFDQIILVDDASKDDTYKLAKKLRIKSYRNPKNLGYGGNMKRAIDLALKHKADIIVDLHPDNEYSSSSIPLALKRMNQGYEFILGNRFTNLTTPKKSGMYSWKLAPIVFLNFLDRVILNVKINDLHQGFRVYSRKLFEKVNYHANSNNYLFSFELIAQAVAKNIKISQVPVKTNYTGKKRGASLKNSLIYSVGTFKILVFFLLTKIGIENQLFKDPIKNN